ncbi:DUF3347 domain-containing protein [bacterium]|jgi:hypothetical protein|nr:DUF3347 domain-containing protein [bacterium]
MNKKYILIAIATIGLSAGLILLICAKTSCGIKTSASCEIKKAASSCCANKSNTSKKCQSDHVYKNGASCEKTRSYSKKDTHSHRGDPSTHSHLKTGPSLSTHFFNIQTALSKDEFDSAISHAKQLNTLSSSQKESSIALSSKTISAASTIYEARAEFETLSKEMEKFYTTNGIPKGQTIAKYHCPMAKKNKGASWLQNSEGVQNPYYGAAMYHCGSKTQSL